MIARTICVCQFFLCECVASNKSAFNGLINSLDAILSSSFTLHSDIYVKPWIDSFNCKHIVKSNIINKHGNLIWIVYDVELWLKRHIDENSIIFHKRYRLFAFHQPFEMDKFTFILNSFHSIHISSGLLDRWLSWSFWIVFKLESRRRRQLHSPANSKRTIGQSISNNYGMCLKWKQKHSTLDSGLIIAISCALASFCRVGFYDLIYLNRDVNLLWY